MVVICPNCEAEYKIQSLHIPENGIEVKCLDCSQNWIEYNFGRVEDKVNANSDGAANDDLKQLAAEELQISRGKKTDIYGTIKDASDSDHAELLEKENPKQLEIQNRLKDSSNLLKKAQSTLKQIETEPVERKNNVHNSTIFGFLASSALFFIFLCIYLYSQKILQVLPSLSSAIDNYIFLVDIILEEILLLFNKIKSFFI